MSSSDNPTTIYLDEAITLTEEEANSLIASSIYFEKKDKDGNKIVPLDDLVPDALSFAAKYSGLADAAGIPGAGHIADALGVVIKGWQTISLIQGWIGGERDVVDDIEYLADYLISGQFIVDYISVENLANILFPPSAFLYLLPFEEFSPGQKTIADSIEATKNRGNWRDREYFWNITDTWAPINNISSTKNTTTFDFRMFSQNYRFRGSALDNRDTMTSRYYFPWEEVGIRIRKLSPNQLLNNRNSRKPEILGDGSKTEQILYPNQYNWSQINKLIVDKECFYDITIINANTSYRHWIPSAYYQSGRGPVGGSCALGRDGVFIYTLTNNGKTGDVNNSAIYGRFTEDYNRDTNGNIKRENNLYSLKTRRRFTPINYGGIHAHNNVPTTENVSYFSNHIEPQLNYNLIQNLGVFYVNKYGGIESKAKEIADVRHFIHRGEIAFLMEAYPDIFPIIDKIPKINYIANFRAYFTLLLPTLTYKEFKNFTRMNGNTWISILVNKFYNFKKTYSVIFRNHPTEGIALIKSYNSFNAEVGLPSYTFDDIAHNAGFIKEWIIAFGIDTQYTYTTHISDETFDKLIEIEMDLSSLLNMGFTNEKIFTSSSIKLENFVVDWSAPNYGTDLRERARIVTEYLTTIVNVKWIYPIGRNDGIYDVIDQYSKTDPSQAWAFMYPLRWATGETTHEHPDAQGNIYEWTLAGTYTRWPGWPAERSGDLEDISMNTFSINNLLDVLGGDYIKLNPNNILNEMSNIYDIIKENIDVRDYANIDNLRLDITKYYLSGKGNVSTNGSNIIAEIQSNSNNFFLIDDIVAALEELNPSNKEDLLREAFLYFRITTNELVTSLIDGVAPLVKFEATITGINIYNGPYTKIQAVPLDILYNDFIFVVVDTTRSGVKIINKFIKGTFNVSTKTWITVERRAKNANEGLQINLDVTNLSSVRSAYNDANIVTLDYNVTNIEVIKSIQQEFKTAINKFNNTTTSRFNLFSVSHALKFSDYYNYKNIDPIILYEKCGFTFSQLMYSSYPLSKLLDVLKYINTRDSTSLQFKDMIEDEDIESIKPNITYCLEVYNYSQIKYETGFNYSLTDYVEYLDDTQISERSITDLVDITTTDISLNSKLTLINDISIDHAIARGYSMYDMINYSRIINHLDDNGEPLHQHHYLLDISDNNRSQPDDMIDNILSGASNLSFEPTIMKMNTRMVNFLSLSQLRYLGYTYAEVNKFAPNYKLEDYEAAGYPDNIHLTTDNSSNITWLYSEGKTIEWIKKNVVTSHRNLIGQLISINVPYTELLLHYDFYYIIHGFYINDNNAYNGVYNKTRIDNLFNTLITNHSFTINNFLDFVSINSTDGIFIKPLSNYPSYDLTALYTFDELYVSGDNRFDTDEIINIYSFEKIVSNSTNINLLFRFEGMLDKNNNRVTLNKLYDAGVALNTFEEGGNAWQNLGEPLLTTTGGIPVPFDALRNEGINPSVNDIKSSNYTIPPIGNIQTVSIEVGTPLVISLSGIEFNKIDKVLTFDISGNVPTKGSVTINDNQVTYTAYTNASGTDSFQYTVSDGSLISTPTTINVVLYSVLEQQEETKAKSNAVGMSDAQITTLKTTDKDDGILDLGNNINALFSDSNEPKKKKRRHSVARTVFAQHKFKDETIIKMKKENLGLSSRVTRANINVIKAGQTIHASTDKSADTSWYSAIEHGEDITIQPLSGSTYKITRTDVYEEAHYSVALTGWASSGGSLDVRTTSSTYLNNNPPYFMDEDEAVINGEQLVFGGVEGGANPPTGADKIVAVTAGQSVVIDLSGSDVDTSYNFLVFDISGTAPTKGSLSDVTGNQVTYTATVGKTGEDTFQYFVNDTSSNSGLYTVTLNITSPPTGANQSVNVTSGQSVVIDLFGSDIDGNNLTFETSGTVSTKGSLGVVSGNQVTYTANDETIGQDTFQYYVNDGTTDSILYNVTVNIISPPIGSNQNVNVFVGQSVDIDLFGSYLDDDDLIFSISNIPTYGVLNDICNNQVTYTANASIIDPDKFKYIVGDGNANSGSYIITMNIISTPLGANQSVSVMAGQSVNIDLSGSDIDGDSLTYVISGTTPSKGSLGDVIGNQVTFTATAGKTGEDSFQYHVNDGTSNSVAYTVTVNITSPPTGANQSVNVNVGTPLVIDLSGSDIDGDNLTFELSGTTPSKGSLGDVSGNKVTYTATAGKTGEDTFQYHVSDGVNNSVAYTVTVNITSPPTGANQSVNVTVGTPLVIDLSGSDTDGDSLTYEISSQPTKGSIDLCGNQVTYTADTGSFWWGRWIYWTVTGTDSFQYIVNDGVNNSVEYTVTVNINNLPTGAIQTINVNVGTPLDVVLSGSDVDGDDLTYTISNQPTKGSLGDVSGNKVTYTATAGKTGEDSFQYRVNDGNSNSVEYTITVNINNLPTGAIQPVAVEVGTPLVIDLSGSDIDGDDLTYTISSQPTKGSLGDVSGNQVTYTATAGATGADTFQYRVNDGTSNSIEYTITVNINTVNINNPPTGAIQTVDVECGNTISYCFVWF